MLPTRKAHSQFFAYLERSAESRTWWYIQSTKVRRDNTQHTSTRGSSFVPVFLYTQARLTFAHTFQDLRRTANSATLADPAFHQQRKGRSDWPHKRSLAAEAHTEVSSLRTTALASFLCRWWFFQIFASMQDS